MSAGIHFYKIVKNEHLGLLLLESPTPRSGTTAPAIFVSAPNPRWKFPPVAGWLEGFRGQVVCGQGQLPDRMAYPCAELYATLFGA